MKREPKDIREDFPALLDGELTEEERRRLEAELADDADLLRELENHKRVDQLYRRLDAVPAPDDFEAALKNRMQQRAPAIRALRSRLWPVLAAAAVLLLLAGGVLFQLILPDASYKQLALDNRTLGRTAGPEEMETRAKDDSALAEEVDVDRNLYALDEEGAADSSRLREELADEVEGNDQTARTDFFFDMNDAEMGEDESTAPADTSMLGYSISSSEAEMPAASPPPPVEDVRVIPEAVPPITAGKGIERARPEPQAEPPMEELEALGYLGDSIQADELPRRTTTVEQLARRGEPGFELDVNGGASEAGSEDAQPEERSYSQQGDQKALAGADVEPPQERFGGGGGFGGAGMKAGEDKSEASQGGGFGSVNGNALESQVMAAAPPATAPASVSEEPAFRADPSEPAKEIADSDDSEDVTLGGRLRLEQPPAKPRYWTVAGRVFEWRDDGWYEETYGSEAYVPLGAGSVGLENIISAEPELGEALEKNEAMVFRYKNEWYRVTPAAKDSESAP